MTTQAMSILESQRKSWDTFSPGWERWNPFTMAFLEPQGEAIIRSLDIGPDSYVLDIATGTGEPGLTMAAMARRGKVIATDLSEGMLRIAAREAQSRGLDNFETLVADAGRLPFADNTFDAVSCRLGFMFFPDMEEAAREMYRVLKPSGRIALTVWDTPEKNRWVTAMMGPLKRHFDLPSPPPDAPGLFRCAGAGAMSDLLRKVGFNQLDEREVLGTMTCETKEEYWDFMTDVVPPVVMAFQQGDPAARAAVRQEVFRLLDTQYPGAKKHIDFGACLISGKK